VLLNDKTLNLNRYLSSSNTYNLHEFDDETYLSGDDV